MCQRHILQYCGDLAEVIPWIHLDGIHQLVNVDPVGPSSSTHPLLDIGELDHSDDHDLGDFSVIGNHHSNCVLCDISSV